LNFFKKIRVTIFFAFFSLFSFAQKDSCEFILVDAANTGNTDYYLASNANGWNAKDENYKFRKDADGTHHLICFLTKGTLLEFKFTKGSWETVELDKNGLDITNRVIKTDTAKFTVYYIPNWKNNTAIPKKHTASSNVKIIDTAFFIPQLNTTRRIWIYLPKDYASSTKRYPVLYMHDGQNLFDEVTSAYGEWGVDECLDSLSRTGKPGCIVVGIDNGQLTRMNEYNPYEFTWKDSATSKTFTPQGDAYLEFLVKTLKPFIDRHYNTLPSKENTIIAGSSMGGLISYYAALKYSEVFGKAGVFSPAFWTAPAIKKFTADNSHKINGKFFFYAGGLEGQEYINEMNEVAEKLGANSNAMIYSVIDEEGKHNEAAWHKWFTEFYNWIMADGYNNVIKLEE
jgi:predicted alpha/beta superfamily hydrolase